ncbi:MAG: molybdenum cofactor guanylyltransferase [Pseudohongiellaceae bacterium]|nr:molybdenum cofactor guanylyltransferase [Pseudohongiellaceae bacterium]
MKDTQLCTGANNISAVVLAGGKGSRMGSPTKPLLPLDDKPIIAHICASIRSSVAHIIVSANNYQELYKEYADALVSDDELYRDSCPGPLLGILAALKYARSHYPATQYLCCFPGDAPLFPQNIVQIMYGAIEQANAQIAWIENDGQPQPLFSMWKLQVIEELEQAIKNGQYSPMAFIKQQHNTLIKLSSCDIGHFDNLNFPEDLQKARNLIAT